MTNVNELHDAIAANVQQVRLRITRACETAGRSPEEVTLIAVTKNKSVEHAKAALECGITHFGENRVQEAKEKAPLLSTATWHMIGSLQSNKVKPALSLFSCIHSVDRPSLVDELAKHHQASSVPLLMQVNISGESTKQGIEPAAAESLARRISSAGLTLVGLMTVAPLAENPEDVRSVFRSLRQLSRQLQELALPGVDLQHLSMGMSGDFEVAIQEGATMVRIGSAIFGSRVPTKP